MAELTGQGGLDCRYLVGELKPTKFKVISVTTISTPHRGSPFADYLIDNIVGREWFAALCWGWAETLGPGPSSGTGNIQSSLAVLTTCAGMTWG